MPQILVA
ncbi:TPA_asm: UL23 uORF 2 [Human alphaherpesvirus 1]|nr:TPA_asm: UL23 uORF 2 [Human alphaherpesvirus 1]